MIRSTLLRTMLLLLAVPGMRFDGRAQVFRADDPLTVDRDNLPVPKPQRTKINDYYDFFENTFFPRGEKRRPRALNINTLGNVPDSSWYTNRLERPDWTRERLIRGPNTDAGPAPGRWVVVSGKSQGISPGFRIRDARGDEYFLKFDPQSNPEMATAAEVISTKFFYALGYHVPANYLAEFHPSDLVVDPGATVENELGERNPLNQSQVDALLSTVAVKADGRIRAVASRRISGEDLGPFKFYGTRGDDANDIFPHEHRRELRGYYIFCAWLNHDDSRSINTRDFYVREGELGHVRHYLIDFGSTLGSGSVFAQRLRPGNEYMWEAGPTFATMLSLGLWIRPWIRVEYPDYPSVGRIESTFFTPQRWKPEYPNVAFDHMDSEDAFWAIRLLLRLQEDDIRAAVREGKLSDPAAEEHLIRSLIQRREKLGNYWLRQVSSLDNFRIQNDALLFDDLLNVHGFETVRSPQTVRFASFDNRAGSQSPLGGEHVVREGGIPLPPEILRSSNGSYFVVRLSAGSHGVDVYLRMKEGSLQIVGLERR